MSMSMEAQHTLNELRVKAANNTISMEELRIGIEMIRKDRVGAAIASTTSRKKKAAAAKPDADDLLSELEGM